MTTEQVLIAAAPLVGGWMVWVSRTVSAHEALIKKIDTLVDLLLEERLSDDRS
jgi:pantothenate kinase-related protein Tda10